jgi:3-hydroxybutyryl-CoA dehydrogenase
VHVGIVGFGKMGRSIAALLADTPATLTILGRDEAAMAREHGRAEQRRRRAAAFHGAAAAPAGASGGQRFTVDWDDLRGCDLVLESVAEEIEIKREVLRRTEAVVAADAVIASNTSCLPLTLLAAGLARPGRFCGLHFFHPVRLTTVVEIIRTDATAPGVVAGLQDLVTGLGRTPLVVRDHSGSCINVPLVLHCLEAVYILEQGAALPSRIDDLVTRRIARVGPCETIDALGATLALQLLERTTVAFGGGRESPALCRTLIADGRLGRHAGAGLYLYRDRAVDDVPEYYRRHGQAHTRADAPTDDDALCERLLYAIYDGLLTLARRGLGDLPTLSAGVRDVMGLSEDPLEAMRRLGATGLRAGFERLHAALGPRFDPAGLDGALESLDDPGRATVARQ